MIIGIMQPYFFPYLGYFSLLKQVDRFILFDTVQFIRHGWIERNRILKPCEGVQYICVPLVKASHLAKIKDVSIRNNEDWRNHILCQLNHYKKKAPFYKETMAVVERALAINTESITYLNHNTMNCVCDYLGIKKNIEIFSQMNLEIEPANEPDEWALNICKKLGNVEEYWNPIGGLSFFNPEKYEKSGIKIHFQSVKIKRYPQRRPVFEEKLSIIDVMMFNSPTEINRMLDDYSLF